MADRASVGEVFEGALEAAIDRVLVRRLPDIARLIAEVLQPSHADTPAAEPLARITGQRPDAARMMEQRYPALRELAVGTVGRRRLYRREDVLAWIASRKEAEESTPRSLRTLQPKAS